MFTKKNIFACNDNDIILIKSKPKLNITYTCSSSKDTMMVVRFYHNNNFLYFNTILAHESGIIVIERK